MSVAQRALLVVTSTRDAGELTSGYWFEELASPYLILTEAGWDVTIASPKGGAAPRDPMSEEDDWQTDFTGAFAGDAEANRKIADTVALADVDPAEFDAVCLIGGIATMWDFPDNADLARIVEAVDAKEGIVSSICHGAAGLLPAKASGGGAFVSGRQITCWTDAEERVLKLEDKVPFLLETRLREQGAAFDGGENFADVVRVDGRLVTGQNPMSSAATARAIIDVAAGSRVQAAE